MAIANKINNTPIAIKIIDKIFEIPKSLSGNPPCTVTEFVLLGELLVEDDVLDELAELEVFLVFVEFVLDVFVLDVFVLLDVLELVVVFSVFVSVIFISTAKTLVAKDNNTNNILIIKNIFKFLIIFYTSINIKKFVLSSLL